MRTLLSALSVLLVLGLLAACVESDDAEDDSAGDDVAVTDDPTETPEPDPTPTPEPDPTSTPEPDPTPTPEETATPQDDDSDDEPTEHVVEIGDNFFDPDTLTIAAGDTVRFVNEGEMTHTATLDPEAARDSENIIMPDDAETWDSGSLDPGDEFSVTLDVPGEYQYICLPHEALDMFGEIVVEDGASADPAGSDDEDDADNDDDDEADDYL